MGFTYAAASLENGTQTYAKFTRWSRTAAFSFFPPLSIETEQNSTPTCFDPFDKVENLGGIVPNCRMTANINNPCKKRIKPASDVSTAVP